MRLYCQDHIVAHSVERLVCQRTWEARAEKCFVCAELTNDVALVEADPSSLFVRMALLLLSRFLVSMSTLWR
jgi:hypothetical protein